MNITAYKVSVFGVILVRIFPHADRIQSECGKMRTKITPNMDTFHVVHGSTNWFTIDPNGFQQKYFLKDFPQLLVLRLLRTHISGCFQSVRFRSSCLQNTRKVCRKTNLSESF